jgi:thymidylate kinase
MTASRRGVWAAFLGPDGSGKSTVIRRVEADLAPRFARVRRFHLRTHFGLRGPDGPPELDPHGRPKRAMLTSLLKLGLWWTDCTLGYFVAVRPALRRRGLVLFDRCIDDLLVDPRRYRYGAPMTLARLVARLAPRPHVMLVLDAPPAVLSERKREVDPQEMIRQREQYRALASTRRNAVLVDASRSIEDVVEEVEDILLRVGEDAPR